MKLKRIGYVLLCVLLICSVCACGKNVDKGKTDELGVYTIDESGNKVYHLVMYDHGYSLPASYTKRELVSKKLNEKLLADLGFKIDVTVYSYALDYYHQKLQAALSNGEQVDVFRWYSYDVGNFYDNDLLLGLNNYKKYMPDIIENTDKFSKTAFQEVTYDHELYAIPSTSFAITGAFWYRGDILREMQYVNSDNSIKTPNTFKEFEEYLYAVKKANLLNGNNTAPLAATFDDLKRMILGYFTETPLEYYSETDDKIYPSEYSTGYKEFVLKVEKWLADGIVSNALLFSGNDEEKNKALKNKNSAVIASDIWMLNSGSLKAIDKENPTFEITYGGYLSDMQAIPAPLGTITDVFMIPYTAKSPGVVAKLYNWALYNEENYILIQKGVENESYTRIGNSINVTPENEKKGDLMVSDCMGRFMVGENSKFEMKYLSSNTNEQTILAYDEAMNSPFYKMIQFVSPLNICPVILDDLAEIKLNSARSNMLSKVQSFIKGNTELNDKNWNEMKAKFESDGGINSLQGYVVGYKAYLAGR